MKSVSRIIFLVAGLSLLAMACGLGSTATDKINEAVDSAATQVVEKVATTVATAMPEAGTAVAEVQKAATEVALRGKQCPCWRNGRSRHQRVQHQRRIGKTQLISQRNENVF